jgi:hypothetical protein
MWLPILAGAGLGALQYDEQKRKAQAQRQLAQTTALYSPWTGLTPDTKFDDPSRVSAGEWVSLNPTGGAIALMTTTRSVFFGVNSTTIDAFFNYVFEREPSGDPMTFGKIIQLTKNNSQFSENRRCFSLIGDPALQIALPRYSVVTDSINHVAVNQFNDTIKALSKMHVSGHLEDVFGNKLSGFNGVVSPTILDKEKSNSTLMNDPESPLISFKTQKNALYKGKATVLNGDFQFEFLVPKDIDYSFGKGRISYYANSAVTDAFGNILQPVIEFISKAAVPVFKAFAAN